MRRSSWRVVSAAALLLASLSILVSAFLFTRIQNERTYALTQTCLRESDRSSATIAFLRDLGVRPMTLAKARERFPVLSVAQCEQRAQGLVKSPPPRHDK